MTLSREWEKYPTRKATAVDPKQERISRAYSRFSLVINGETKQLICPTETTKTRDIIADNIRLSKEIDGYTCVTPFIYSPDGVADLALKERWNNLGKELSEQADAYAESFSKYEWRKLASKVLRSFILFILEMIVAIGIYCLIASSPEKSGLKDFAHWWLIAAIAPVILSISCRVFVRLAKHEAREKREQLIKLLAFRQKNLTEARKHQQVAHQHQADAAMAELLIDIL